MDQEDGSDVPAEKPGPPPRPPPIYKTRDENQEKDRKIDFYPKPEAAER